VGCCSLIFSFFDLYFFLGLIFFDDLHVDVVEEFRDLIELSLVLSLELSALSLHSLDQLPVLLSNSQPHSANLGLVFLLDAVEFLL
jgi:hypothetical protein